MTAKVVKPGEFGVVKYFETAFPEFKKHGLDLVATFTEFKVCDEKNGNAIFTCATVAGLDGFLRGLTHGSKK